MRNGANKTEYTPEEYELDVHKLLDAMFPYSVLSGLRLFSAETRQHRDHGFELDNLIHLRLGGTDHIIVVEAKKPSIRAEGGKWNVAYADGPKCARKQVDNHVRTLWEYLRPIAQGVDLKFVAAVCTLESSRRTSSDGYLNSDLHLISVDDLLDFFADKFLFGSAEDAIGPEVLRVSQSSFLSMLRLGASVPSLGHPEVVSAVRYVERCRRALDATLFLDFKPKRERWAINGSAGMGKSVLLAYSAAVLASGREWQGKPGEEFARPSKLLESIGYSADESSGPIYVVAMTTKQLEQLQKFYREFVRRFQAGDYSGQITFRRVEFVVCRDAKKISTWCGLASALLVDEAHDLPAYAAKEISEKHASRSFYLILAYDRHQKLRLTRSDSRIMEGVDFTGKTDRLRQIYRNPVPVYMASLALMFRWLPSEGPKVIPDKKDLESNFAFDVRNHANGDIEVSMKTDAHPANAWAHTVATFPDADTAFKSLENDRMGHAEVLWVRFCEEDPEFDYERLRRFTYHNCRNYDSDMISDKYVKGQEYPIVVIEGFPSFMDRYEDSEYGKADEGKMWKFRREVYLCASRATCFLYFVCNPRQFTAENRRILSELDSLVESLAVPSESVRGRTRVWSLRIRDTGASRQVADVDEAIAQSKADMVTVTEVPEDLPAVSNPLLQHQTATELPLAPDLSRLKQPITVESMAKVLGVKTHAIRADLMSLRVFAASNQILSDEQVAAICQMRGLDYEPRTAKLKANTNSESASQNKESVATGASPMPSKFKHSIAIQGPVSAVELASLLGRQKREIIIEAQRIGIPVTGATPLGLYVVERIAGVFGVGVVQK